MSGTRIRPDKQIQTAPGQGYVLHSDTNGELQFSLLSSLTSDGGGGTTGPFIGDVRSIDSVQLVGTTLVLQYTTNQGTQLTRSCNLESLAVDVKVTGAILQRPDANTYILQLTESDGSTVTVNLSDLLAVVTANSTEILFTGNGTAANPLSATLSESVKTTLGGGHHWTDEFTGLTTGSSVLLAHTPLYPFPLHVYRNGLRQKEFVEWRKDEVEPKRIVFKGPAFGANGQAEIVVVDYKTALPTPPRETPEQ